MEEYKLYNGKKLRYGYTTGTCAAAATKAAAYYMKNKIKIDTVDIDTPKGWTVNVPIIEIGMVDNCGFARVIKDSGDDPDVTNGIEIKSTIGLIPELEVNVKGGIGVGIVTKKGLQVPVGDSAINPVPKKMIKNEYTKIFGENQGANIVIDVPLGQEISKKTLNRKLGIINGISIIGTTGIVEPMSESALIESLHLEIKRLGTERKTMVMILGNYGKNFSKNNVFLENKMVKVSNFIGDCLDFSVSEGFEKILLIGHIGKLVKVAGGIFNTHSKTADARMEILASHYLLYNENINVFKKIMTSNTTDEAVDYILENGDELFFDKLADTISKKCMERTKNIIQVGTILFNLSVGELGKCDISKELLIQMNDGGNQ